MKTETAKMSV